MCLFFSLSHFHFSTPESIYIQFSIVHASEEEPGSCIAITHLQHHHYQLPIIKYPNIISIVVIVVVTATVIVTITITITITADKQQQLDHGDDVPLTPVNPVKQSQVK